MSKITLRHAEIAQSYGNPKSLAEFTEMVKAMMAKREAAAAEIRVAAVRIATLWRPFFFTSVGTGFVAGLLLLALLLRHNGLWLF
jgi:hypothetical protein